MFIVPFRMALTSLVRDRSEVPVYGFLPDDPAHLPVVVVGRPSLREHRTAPAVVTLTSTVTLLGRRISDEDSQAELDALADALYLTLGGTRSVRRGDFDYRTVLFRPGTVMVAGTEYPAYLADVSADATSCD